jgi:hypothetical protein
MPTSAGSASARALLRRGADHREHRSSHVVKVHEAGTEGDDVYVAMEFAGRHAPALAAIATHTKPRSSRCSCSPSRARSRAHAAGLRASRLRFDNVLVTAHGVPRVADFGLVGHAAGSEPPSHVTLTSWAQIIGTPQYMAPELLAERGRDREERSVRVLRCAQRCTVRPPAIRGQHHRGADERRARRELVVPASPSVPARLRTALVRGLAATPERAGRR